MNEKQNTVLAICVASGFLCTLQAIGSVVPIVNPSFEEPLVATTPYYEYGGAGSGAIPGWTISGPGVAGVWNPGQYPGIAAPAPDGIQTGFIGDGGSHATTSVSQTLTTALTPNTTYHLSIAVGGRSDGYNPGTDYSVSLLGGSTLLSSVTPVMPPTLAWTYLSLTYTSGAVITPGLLEIVISMPASGASSAQLDFDNVSLSTVPEASTVIAGSLLLLPFGASTLRILRRKQSA